LNFFKQALQQSYKCLTNELSKHENDNSNTANKRLNTSDK